jgi:hypothetical protein
MKKIKKIKYVLFWIKSSRDTDEKKVQKFPIKATKDEIKEILERWCSNFGAWNDGDNLIKYGHKTIKMPSRKELLYKWKKLYERKNKIDEQVNTLRAMLATNN